MAAINFPDAPTNGQIFESGGMSWTYVAGIGWTLNSAIVEAGSGFTFIADTMPLPVNVGDTWFDSSTGASGGTSWVAIEEGPAGASEKVWVQFAPGSAQTVSPKPGRGIIWYYAHTSGVFTSTAVTNSTVAQKTIPGAIANVNLKKGMSYHFCAMAQVKGAGTTPQLGVASPGVWSGSSFNIPNNEVGAHTMATLIVPYGPMSIDSDMTLNFMLSMTVAGTGVTLYGDTAGYPSHFWVEEFGFGT